MVDVPAIFGIMFLVHWKEKKTQSVVNLKGLKGGQV